MKPMQEKKDMNSKKTPENINVSLDYIKRLEESVEYIKNKINSTPEVSLVLGSGLGEFANELEDKVVIPYKEIPNFPVSTVHGHAGNLVNGTCAGRNILAFQGRVHCYEGHSSATVAFGARVARLLGVDTMIVTNAAGGLDPSFQVGDLMLLKNHISLFAQDPSEGLSHPTLGSMFYPQTDPYSEELCKTAHDCAKELGIDLKEGVYCMLKGPRYESRSDVKALSVLGASAVGMSTVPETLAMCQMGLKKILGISLITNMAAGILDSEPTHEEVMETANQRKKDFKNLLSSILNRL